MPWTQLAPRRRQLSTMRLCTNRSVSPGRTVGSTSRYASSSSLAPASRAATSSGVLIQRTRSISSVLSTMRARG